jgi:hypothetical protein
MSDAREAGPTARHNAGTNLRGQGSNGNKLWSIGKVSCGSKVYFIYIVARGHEKVGSAVYAQLMIFLLV